MTTHNLCIDRINKMGIWIHTQDTRYKFYLKSEYKNIQHKLWRAFKTDIPVNPPPFRGSLPRKNLISRMDWVSCAGDINLSHTSFPPARYPPNKKIKYNKILTYILRSIFLEIPHLELPRWWKTLRDTNVNDIRLLICLTPLQVNWVMVIN